MIDAKAVALAPGQLADIGVRNRHPSFRHIDHASYRRKQRGLAAATGPPQEHVFFGLQIECANIEDRIGLIGPSESQRSECNSSHLRQEITGRRAMSRAQGLIVEKSRWSIDLLRVKDLSRDGRSEIGDVPSLIV